MTSFPTLNMIGWSILDYELAFDGIRQINDASLWLQNQPRAFNSAKGEYQPGADFVCRVGEDWCGSIISEIVDSLRAIRFPDPREEERRILLLIHFETSWGPSCDPLAAIIQMALQQSVKAAA